MLDVNRLRIFRAVVNAGSVNAAAANLGYSPSAVSQHITALQRETGLTLFEKSGRGITPTQAGLTLAANSGEIMSSMGRLEGLVEDLRIGRTGSLSIATFPSAGQYWLPAVVTKLLEADNYPDVVLRMDLVDLDDATGTGHDLEIRAERPQDRAVEIPGYRRIPVMVEPYVLIAPRGHRVVDLPHLRLADVAAEPLIAEGQLSSLCARIIEGAWAASGVTPRYVARVGDHVSAVALVNAGVGLSVLPRLATGTLPDNLIAREFDSEFAPTRRIVLHVRDEAATWPVTQRAVELLMETAGATFAGAPA